jgi:Zn-dependent protease/predicted transcriptional regulator
METTMKWSWKLAKIAGIDIHVHATFLLLLIWVAVTDYQRSGTAEGAVRGLMYILALFTSVVLHEYGHALTARRFGIRTRNITLLPIGGVAQLERMPEDPRQELLVAVAGPAVTIAIVIALYVVLKLFGLPTMTADAAAGGAAAPFLARLMWVNIVLALFNLLPAFPMDGGRVLRAVLAMRTDYVRATETAARIGRGFAFVFGMIGLLYNPFLVLIALFVWMGAAAEAATAQFRFALADVPVERVMITDVRTLSPGDRLDTAVDHILSGFQQDFPVVEDSTVVGVMTRTDLLAALARRGRDAPVADVMAKTFQTAEPTELLSTAFERLRECKCHTLPVLRNRRLVGVLTMENVGEFVMIESALRGERA